MQHHKRAILLAVFVCCSVFIKSWIFDQPHSLKQWNSVESTSLDLKYLKSEGEQIVSRRFLLWISTFFSWQKTQQAKKIAHDFLISGNKMSEMINCATFTRIRCSSLNCIELLICSLSYFFKTKLTAKKKWQFYGWNITVNHDTLENIFHSW